MRETEVHRDAEKGRNIEREIIKSLLMEMRRKGKGNVPGRKMNRKEGKGRIICKGERRYVRRGKEEEEGGIEAASQLGWALLESYHNIIINTNILLNPYIFNSKSSITV